ncbi:MAG: winged helix-turn-helix domain-containing protein [Pyrinomonadaceae bacterium]
MKRETQRIYQFEDFQLDPGNRQLRRGERVLPLPAKAFDLLLALVEKNGRLVEKDELFSRVWSDQIVEESNLTVYISQIRKALGENSKKPRFIETVPGFGYRFTGEVFDREGAHLLIETEMLSRITIETESEDLETSDQPPVAGVEKRMKGSPGPEVGERDLAINGRAARKRLGFWLGAAVAILAGLSLMVGAYFLRAKRTPAFEKIRITRLTNNGRVAAATMSRDGKFVAYVLGEAEGNSLWVRQTGVANDQRIVPPVKDEFWGVTFSPDETQIYYNLFSFDRADARLFRIPTLGGVSQEVTGIATHAISFSPDGRRFAYVQPDSASEKNYLMIAEADGTNRRVLAEKPQPNTFIFDGPFVAWSPDGETIACLVNHLEAESNYALLVGVRVKDGTESPLSERRWHDVTSFAWRSEGDGLLLAGSEKNAAKNQIWLVSEPAGEISPVTDDPNEYYEINTSAGGQSFMALQTASINGIYVGDPAAGESSFREIASEVGGLNPLLWTPDDKIVFRSLADGAGDLWQIEPDGKNRRQLTNGAEVDRRGMCFTPAGKYIIFVSWLSGKSNLWRVNADGTGLKQMTEGEADAYPDCSPDEGTFIFQRGILSQPHLWKATAEGGSPAPLADFRAKWGVLSRSGDQISFFQISEDKWKIGFMPVGGGEVLRLIDVPSALKESKTLWAEDDRSLFFIGVEGNVGNLWKLPLDGGEPKPVTNFKTKYLNDFAWSPDGTRLAVSRSSYLSDVVLIERAD